VSFSVHCSCFVIQPLHGTILLVAWVPGSSPCRILVVNMLAMFSAVVRLNSDAFGDWFGMFFFFAAFEPLPFLSSLVSTVPGKVTDPTDLFFLLFRDR